MYVIYLNIGAKVTIFFDDKHLSQDLCQKQIKSNAAGLLLHWSKQQQPAKLKLSVLKYHMPKHQL
jgi:hypothetical protein